MARIRSIKPSFFTNEDLAELSPWHRLCFAGLWTQADREGRLEDRPKRLKAAIFPYDKDIDMEALLTGLAEKQFIVRYAADGVAYIAVLGFLKHQRPKSDEAASVIPAPILENPRGIVTTPRQGRDRGQGTEDREEGTGEVSADGALFGAAAPASPRPEDFQLAWNSETHLPLPRCRDLTTKRRRHIKARLTERPLTEWVAVMQRIQASSFCRGEVAPRNGNETAWVASFDWLIGSPDVAVKVLEGKYDDRAATPQRRKPAVSIPDGSRGGTDWMAECREAHGGSCDGHKGLHDQKMSEWCNHTPRCHNPAWHAVVVAREKGQAV